MNRSHGGSLSCAVTIVTLFATLTWLNNSTTATYQRVLQSNDDVPARSVWTRLRGSLLDSEADSPFPTFIPTIDQTIITSEDLSIVVSVDCASIAPCHVDGSELSSRPLTCVKFYASRFWEAAPDALKDDLQWQRNHRPANCWYETELLTLVQEDKNAVVYDHAVCDANYTIPETITYLHNFKAGGTTVRHALGYKRVPLYEPATHVFSDMLLEIFPDATYDDYTLYDQYADHMKEVTYERQLSESVGNEAFTFVRSPVQRFLSGLEQVERLNDLDWEVSDEARPCFDFARRDDPQLKVECVVDSLLETRVFFNVHLYPQAYLFDSWTRQGAHDMAVTVLPLMDMDAFLQRLTGEVIPHARESTVEGAKQNVQAQDLHPHLLAKILSIVRIGSVASSYTRYGGSTM